MALALQKTTLHCVSGGLLTFFFSPPPTHLCSRSLLPAANSPPSYLTFSWAPGDGPGSVAAAHVLRNPVLEPTCFFFSGQSQEPGNWVALSACRKTPGSLIISAHFTGATHRLGALHSYKMLNPPHAELSAWSPRQKITNSYDDCPTWASAILQEENFP